MLLLIRDIYYYYYCFLFFFFFRYVWCCGLPDHCRVYCTAGECWFHPLVTSQCCYNGGGRVVRSVFGEPGLGELYPFITSFGRIMSFEVTLSVLEPVLGGLYFTKVIISVLESVLGGLYPFITCFGRVVCLRSLCLFWNLLWEGFTIFRSLYPFMTCFGRVIFFWGHYVYFGIFFFFWGVGVYFLRSLCLFWNLFWEGYVFLEVPMSVLEPVLGGLYFLRLLHLFITYFTKLYLIENVFSIQKQFLC